MNIPFERSWKRPNDIAPFPHLWSKITIKRDDRTVKLRIQDLTLDRFDEAWDVFKEHFYRDDEVIRVANQIEDEVTMTSQKGVCLQYARQNVSIIAVIDNKDPVPTIVGVLVLEVLSKGEKYPTLPGETRAKIQNLFKILYDGIDEFEKLKVDKCLKDYAVVVKREYRRLGIANELFKTMEKIAHTFKIPATVVIFNNSLSQALATKLEYSTLSEVKLSDYVDEDGKVILPTTDTKVVRLCYKYVR